MCGEMPNDKNEILLAKDTADFLLKYLGKAGYEDLIGEEVLIGIDGNASRTAWDEVELDYYFEDENAHYCDQMKLVISGITNIENDNMNMVFFTSEFGKNAIMEYYVDSYDGLWYKYVRFIVSPETNMVEFAEKINQDFIYDKNHFVIYESSYSDKTAYRSTSNAVVFDISILGCFLSSIVIYTLFTKKRINKICKQEH